MREKKSLETIKGLTNWRLTVRREGDGVTLLRALTCDRKAVLPDELRELNVPRCLLAVLLVCLGVWIVNRPEKQN